MNGRVLAVACAIALSSFSGCMAAAPDATPVKVAAFTPPPAPAAGEGVQLTVGPFQVPPGQEVQKNFYLKLPVDHDVMVDRLEIIYPAGSHHCNLFKSEVDVADHVEDTFDAKIFEKCDMFANSQSGDLNWSLPKGVGIKLKAHQQLAIQTHWVNGVTQKTDAAQGQVWINMHFADPATIQHTMGLMFIINPQIAIPPKSSWTAIKDVSLTDFGRLEDANIIAMSGHFHSRGKSFRVNRWSGVDNTKNIGEEVYRSENWDEPPFKIFNPPLLFPFATRFLYHVDYVNDSDTEVTFGPKVETQEHANLFIYFYPGPKDGRTIYDTEGAKFQDYSR